MPWVSKVARSSALSICGMALMKVVFAGLNPLDIQGSRPECHVLPLGEDADGLCAAGKKHLSPGGMASAISCQLSKLRQSSSSGCQADVPAAGTEFRDAAQRGRCG